MLGKDQGTDGESKAGRTSQTAIPEIVPYAPARQYPMTLLARQNSSSVVGGDIFPIVLWALLAPIPDKYGKAPPHAFGHR